jgi:hypothetical protein
MLILPIGLFVPAVQAMSCEFQEFGCGVQIGFCADDVHMAPYKPTAKAVAHGGLRLVDTIA